MHGREQVGSYYLCVFLQQTNQPPPFMCGLMLDEFFNAFIDCFAHGSMAPHTLRMLIAYCDCKYKKANKKMQVPCSHKSIPPAIAFLCASLLG